MWRSLHDLLRERRAASPQRPQLDAANAIQLFHENIKSRVPAELRASLHAKKLVDGVLTVEVSHPALAQILRQEEAEILADLTKKGCPVHRFVFTVRQGKTE